MLGLVPIPIFGLVPIPIFGLVPIPMPYLPASGASVVLVDLEVAVWVGFFSALVFAFLGAITFVFFL